jgi:hypothetical protein
MTQSQHDGILFVLATLLACAIAGGALTMCGCGGAEFTVLGTPPPPDATPRDVIETTVEAAVSSSETAAPDVDAMNIRDAESVESTIMRDVELDKSMIDAAPDTASSCDIDACTSACPGGNTRCCTASGACGCHDFGPVCLSI